MYKSFHLEDLLYKKPSTEHLGDLCVLLSVKKKKKNLGCKPSSFEKNSRTVRPWEEPLFTHDANWGGVCLLKQSIISAALCGWGGEMEAISNVYVGGLRLGCHSEGKL